MARAEREAARAARRPGLRLRSALDSGHRQRRRLRRHAPGPQRQDGVEYLAGERQALHRGGQQAARARGRRHGVPPRRAAALRRRELGQGLQARRERTRRLRHAAGAARLDLREPVQPLRPHLEGLPAGRARVPRQGRGHRRLLRAQQGPADGSALDAGARRRHRSDRRSPIATTCIAPSKCSATRRPATARARRWRRSRRWRRRCCPPT